MSFAGAETRYGSNRGYIGLGGYVASNDFKNPYVGELSKFRQNRLYLFDISSYFILCFSYSKLQYIILFQEQLLKA